MNIGRFRFKGDDVAADIRAKYGYDGDLLRIYSENRGAVVHKWHHYIPIYDRYLSRYRGRPIRFLEIGVSKGGSLQIWREYFGADAIIFGIDINANCAQFDGQAGAVRIGSQADPEFLASVVDEMGGLDIVLDDGSHVMSHVRASLETLFPRLETGGIYVVEDMHTAYWRKWGGALGRPRNFFRDMQKIIDDMHRPYHPGESQMPGIGEAVSGVHVHDSIIVLEKDPVFPPVHSKVGK